VNPQLGALQNNGGTTPTHRPAFFSPGHDKGDNTILPATTDQRGFSRTVNWANVTDALGGDGTDIGAVELLVATAAPASISGRAVQTNGRGIANVIVEVADMQGNVLRQARTNSFGYFMLFDVPSGADYVVSASAKRYRFEQPIFVVALHDNVEGIMFVGRGSSSQ
jgi:hypothetical protein